MNLPNVLQLEHLKRTYVCEFSQAVQMLHWTFGTILNLVEYDLAELVPKLLRYTHTYPITNEKL